MEKVRIRKIIEDIIITQFLNSEMDIVHEEDVSFKELGLDSIDRNQSYRLSKLNQKRKPEKRELNRKRL